MQIRRLHGIAIYDAKRTYPGAGNVSCCRTAKTAGADDEDLRRSEPLLAYEVD